MINTRRYIGKYLRNKKNIAISLHPRPTSENFLEEYATSLEYFWKQMYSLMLACDNGYVILKRLLEANKEWVTLQSIKFPCELGNVGDMIEISKFLDFCFSGAFIDYDGYGHFSNGKYKSRSEVYPSQIATNSVTINSEVSHVLWYNITIMKGSIDNYG